MSLANLRDDRGAGLVEYALVVLTIAIGSLVAVSVVGDSMSDSYEEAAEALSSDSDQLEDELTPKEKWEKAQADYDKAIADAKATKAAEIEKAKAEYKAATQANQSLPKAEKKKADKNAKNVLNSAKSTANKEYKASVQTAKNAKSAAKAEYKATK